MNAASDHHSAVETLASLLDAGGDPLLAAFSARLQALDTSSDGSDVTPTDARECASLFETLRQCVLRSADVEQVVALAAEVSRARGALAEPRCRRAMQSLDWALRDLFLDRYGLVHRRQYVAATGLFLDLLRRRTATHAAMTTASKEAPHVDADRRINSPRAANAPHS